MRKMVEIIRSKGANANDGKVQTPNATCETLMSDQQRPSGRMERCIRAGGKGGGDDDNAAGRPSRQARIEEGRPQNMKKERETDT